MIQWIGVPVKIVDKAVISRLRILRKEKELKEEVEKEEENTIVFEF